MPKVSTKPTYVTMPSIVPLAQYMEVLKGAWETGILTHNGPLVQQLERDLCAHLGIKNLIAVTNGTVALQLPFKAFKLQGEIITTPFSWVATSSSILWENCVPVFVDIDPDTFNLDPNKIEAAISHRTTAIMPVHVFSNPCDIEAIDSLAKKHDLKVIYDAAHAMCVNYKGKSVLDYGDITATSFHATKLFNTGEGGACIATNEELHEQLKRIRFFGHDNNKNIVEDGCNGKMTEIHAALGLANLSILDEVCEKRKAIFEAYYQALSDIDFIGFQKFDPAAYNYSYMPIVFDSEERLLTIDAALKQHNIFARRYFYPSLNTIKALGAYRPMPVSENIAKRILCLPSYNDLSFEKVNEVSRIVKG